MLAIVKIAGKQYKAVLKQELKVPRLKYDSGKKIKFDEVLYYSDEKKQYIGTPNVKGAIVTATILNHGREKKILVYKKKRRKGYQRKNGHRQLFSRIKVDSIKLNSPKKSSSKPQVKKTEK